MDNIILKYLLEIQEQTSNGKEFAEHKINANNDEANNLVKAFKHIEVNGLANIVSIEGPSTIDNKIYSESTYCYRSDLTDKSKKFIEEHTQIH